MTGARMNTSVLKGHDLKDALARACAHVGIVNKDVPPDGRWHRSDVLGGNNGKGDASIKLFFDGKGGMVRNWKGEDCLFFADDAHALSEAELIERERMVEWAKAEAAAERTRVAEEAATKCAELWSRARNVDPGHAYVERKGIKPVSAKQWGDALLIPLRDAAGKLRSLQFIQPDGSKRFKSGGAVMGCYSAVGGKPGPNAPLLICEGWATACSLHEATGYSVAAAMSAGNVLAVAQALRGEMPDVPIIVCADNDIGTSGNPGLTKAQEAARVIGARLAVPDFGHGSPEGATDFNDLAMLCGHCVVRDCIEAVWCGKGLDGAAEQSTVVETDEQAIARLAALEPLAYDRMRKAEAQRMGVQLHTLDRMVKAARGEVKSQADTPFSEVYPWPGSVDGATLLTEIALMVRRFIVCQWETAHAVALWVAMTWCIDVVDVAPIAAIVAPEKRCGKSQLLSLMGRLVNRPLPASNVTPAALFRSIDLWHPTVLIDEADAFMRENEELRGLLNCGHTRESAYVIRTVGDDHTPKQFFAWGAKAIAGIGQLADTLMDRSIALELRRKLPTESVDKLRHAEPGLFDGLRSKLARWADDNAEAVRLARPALPEALHDRAADNWEPLFQIAEVAAAQWPTLAVAAALKLSGQAEQGQSTGTQLLADIQEVIEAKAVLRIFSADLLAALCEDEEKPWATCNGGKRMSLRQLSERLQEYGIKSAQVRIGLESKKGFHVEQFRDAFGR